MPRTVPKLAGYSLTQIKAQIKALMKTTRGGRGRGYLGFRSWKISFEKINYS